MEPTKRCPFCAEEIQTAAIRCKHCGADLSGQAQPFPGAVQGAPAPLAPKKKSKRLLWLVLTLFGLWVLFAAVTRNERPTASSSGSTAPTTGVVNAAAPAERERRDFTDVQIGTLLSEYKDNEVRADSQFKGKYFRVSGVVDAVAKDMMNSMYVTVGTGAAFELPKVQCMLRSDQATMASKLSKGSRTSVMGKVEGKMMNVLLRDCELQ